MANHTGDWKVVHEAGSKAGNGTTEQREKAGEFLDGIEEIWEKNQKRQLEFSRKAQMVYARDSGRQVNQERPDLVSQEVKWVLDSL